VTGVQTCALPIFTSAGAMPTQNAMNVDGTSGGPTGTDASPSECIDLGTGTRVMLNIADAKMSIAWHLCFRRDKISVNGELGGPRNILALDFDFDKTPTETIATVKTETADNQLPHFNAIAASAFSGKTFRGDRVISAYTELWIDRAQNPIAPRSAAFLQYAADGKRAYVVGFTKFSSANAQGPGTVTMSVKGVK